MIIVICNDDPNVLGLAVRSQQAAPAVFGQVRQYPNLATLAPNEDLFIIGHGVRKGQGDNSVIGDLAANGLGFNGVQLYEQLANGGVFNGWTAGRVFLLACESLDFGFDSFSLAEVFYAQVAPHRQVRVYGRHNNTIDVIPQPGDAGYVQVTF